MTDISKNTELQQSCITAVMHSADMIIKTSNLGFEIVRWKEPNYHVGVDRFYKLDYALLQINKGSGFSDQLCIRFRKDKYILDNYYSVRFFTVQDIKDLISSLTRISQTEA